VLVREFQIKIFLPECIYQLGVWVLLRYRHIRYGYPFRRIPLSQGKYAIVDPEDYERLKKYKWYARKSPSTFYAVCYISEPKYLGRRNVYMHQLVIDVPAGMDCDHINHNGSDNRNANLRAVTHAQNLWNRRKSPRPSRSKYIGIDWSRYAKRWRSRISVYGKRINLGYFNSEIEAAKEYDEAAKKYHGEFAVLNFSCKDCKKSEILNSKH
jgi:hypothetical protein